MAVIFRKLIRKKLFKSLDFKGIILGRDKIWDPIYAGF